MEKNTEKHFSFLKLFIIIILIISAIIAYGFLVEPKLITVKEQKISLDNWPDNFNGFKIVHISDLHYGRIFNNQSLKKLVQSINEQKPDIVVLTGDLIDKDTHMTTKKANQISNLLKKINATTGKYAVNGNNDLNFDEWVNIVTNGGFKDLNNTYDTIYKDGYSSLFIAGASTVKDKLSINDKLKTSIDYLNSFTKDGPIYKILLLHEPDTIDDLSVNPFDMILAGHSHAGQVRLPFLGPIILPDGAQKYYDNHYKIDNSDLYISNGLGVSNYNFRLFNTPSYSLYRLVQKNKWTFKTSF